MEGFLSQARALYNEAQYALLEKAYRYADKAHRGGMRESGDPYISHPKEVAVILMDMGMDAETVAAGLLHDVIEDTDPDYDDIRAEFGRSIADLVEGVTKLEKLEYYTQEEQQAESARKMIVAMSKDIRVILIKLADRLHNMRTLGFCDEEKRIRKARETLEIYAPLAQRLGISQIQWELEDLSLLYMDPQAYHMVEQKVVLQRKEREASIRRIIEQLEQALLNVGIQPDIDGRPKHFYSIYKKMVQQGKSFEEIYDLIAVRVIVKTEKDCYGALGIVHTLWTPLPGRFKDYIAMPKNNLYQSLHTTVMSTGEVGMPFEVQIRTQWMHQIAEYGIAAHWKYKEGKLSETDLDKKLTWLREILDAQGELRDSQEFMDLLKMDLFSDDVFIFTPKGAVINLPKGSTPLDFAYAIHSAIGNKCIGAKVNGHIVPLETELNTGEVVEIITSGSARGPSLDWLKIVRTSQAKSKIRQWFKKERRDENVAKGRDMLELAVKRQGYPIIQLMREEWLEAIARRFSCQMVDDLYAAVGYGGVTVNQVVMRLVDNYKREVKSEPEQAQETRRGEGDAPIVRDQGVLVKGQPNMAVRYASCCNPVPGDEIIGFITRGRGVSVHRADCSNILARTVERERFIEVSWDAQAQKSYKATVFVTCQQRDGLMIELMNLLSGLSLEVSALNAQVAKNHMVTVHITVEIHDTQQLDKLISQLRRQPHVRDVARVKNG